MTSFVPLPTAEPKDIPRIQTTFQPESEDRKAWRTKRQQEVKSAFVKSWKAYEKYAWLQDEVTPISGGSRQTFGGWGATLLVIDAWPLAWTVDRTDFIHNEALAVAGEGLFWTPPVTLQLFFYLCCIRGLV